MNESLPVALDLRDRVVLVIGGSAEAAERVRQLADVGARVTVICAEPGAELENAVQTHGATLLREGFDARHLAEAWLVVVAERNAALAARVSAACEAQRIFCCAIDQPEHNSFAHMALARAGRLCVAIGTGGSAPGVGRRLRQELERLFADAGLAAFVDEVARARANAPKSDRADVVRRAAARLSIEGRLRLDDAPADDGDERSIG